MNRAEEWPSFGEESLDAMIRLALRYGEENQLRRLARMAEAPLTPGQRAELAALSPRVLQNFDRYRSRQRRAASRARAGRIAARALQTAACVLLPLAVAAPVAMANVEPVRQYVMRMMVKTYDDCSEISLVGVYDGGDTGRMPYSEPLTADQVPEGWKGKYYFSYVPEGFELESMSKFYVAAIYANAENRTFDFWEIEPDESNFIDTEDTEITYVDINGYQAMVVEKEISIGTRTIVSWPMEDVVISIAAELPVDETLKIARSVQKIPPKSDSNVDVGLNKDGPSLDQMSLSSVEVPEDWKGEYFPSYISEGFEFDGVSPYMDDVGYINAAGRCIMYCELGEGGSGGIDTEDARTSYIDINGYTALLVEKKISVGDRTTIAWTVDDKLLLVMAELPTEETIRIAKGVRRVTR